MTVLVFVHAGFHQYHCRRMEDFFDSHVPQGHFFANAPTCRTRREATKHYLSTSHFEESRPANDGILEVLHLITDPFSMGQIVDREIIVRQDQSVRKSVRIGRSDLNAEKRSLKLIKANTTVPVPRVRNYYRTADFEHLIMDKMPGTTLEMAWPMLSAEEQESVADQVVAFIHQLRKLQSSDIQAALLQRQPLRTGLRTATDFCRERVRDYLWNKRIAAFVDDRSAAVGDQPNVFTHGDLDWGNIMVAEGQVCGIIDLESSGFFPPYWEWVTVKRLSQGHPDGSWFCLLEQRLRNVGCPEWDRMWEVEQLIMALNRHSQWALTPEARQANRMRGWHELAEILREDQGDPPLVAYSTASEHPWWLELVS